MSSVSYFVMFLFQIKFYTDKEQTVDMGQFVCRVVVVFLSLHALDVHFGRSVPTDPPTSFFFVLPFVLNNIYTHTVSLMLVWCPCVCTEDSGVVLARCFVSYRTY